MPTTRESKKDIEEFRLMKETELRDRLATEKRILWDLNFKLGSRQLTDVSQIGKSQKRISQLSTLIRALEIQSIPESRKKKTARGSRESSIGLRKEERPMVREFVGEVIASSEESVSLLLEDKKGETYNIEIARDNLTNMLIGKVSLVIGDFVRVHFIRETNSPNRLEIRAIPGQTLSPQERLNLLQELAAEAADLPKAA